jgi:FHA domain
MNLWRVSTRTHSSESYTLSLAQGEYSIGSGPGADIRAYGREISHQHAVLVLGESRLEIRILNPPGDTSLNGLAVGERAVAEYPAVVQVGETIVEVGRFLMPASR